MVDADIPDLSRLALASSSTVRFQQTSIGLPGNSTAKGDAEQLDTSLSSALSHLIDRLIRPLSAIVPDARSPEMREALRATLQQKYAPTWDESVPNHGSGYRSLICERSIGLPVELQSVAKRFNIDVDRWVRVLAKTKVVDGEEVVVTTEWEAWCDPGLVAWRYGGWESEDVVFDPFRIAKHSIFAVWQAVSASHEQQQIEATSSFTPARPSQAIPIRAPALYHIPPTPSQIPDRAASPSLLPAASIDLSGAPITLSGPSAFSSPDSDAEQPGPVDPARYGGEPLPRLEYRRTPEERKERQRSGHVGSNSTSSVDSGVSDTNSGVSQLMTPGSRPTSADIFKSAESDATLEAGKPRGRDHSPTTPHAGQRDATTPATVTGATPAPAASTTPTITPYDGGNVTVLGGGVRLGGSSRPASVMSSHRTPIDRSRSPSISLASRALNSAVGPNTTGGARKPRTRRRIMPTYLGSIHQPGVGGPINGVFSQFIGAPLAGPGGQQQGFNGQPTTSPNMWQGPPGMQPQNMPRPPSHQGSRAVSS